jgi:hypothetical protein
MMNKQGYYYLSRFRVLATNLIHFKSKTFKPIINSISISNIARNFCRTFIDNKNH